MYEDLIESLRAAHAHNPEVADVIAQLFSPEGKDPHSLQFNINLGLEVRGPDGQVKERREIHNLICTAGKNVILDDGAGAKYVKDYAYVMIGTGTTAANAADTALQTESARNIGTVSNPSANTLRVTYTFPAGTGTGAVTESGLDSAGSASAAILCRQVFSAVNKGAADSLQVTFDIT